MSDQKVTTGSTTRTRRELTFDVDRPGSRHRDSSGILGFTVKLDAAVHTCRDSN